MLAEVISPDGETMSADRAPDDLLSKGASNSCPLNTA
jgi:hypothetical protein